MAIFVFIRWSRKKTPMTTDVCSGCVSSPETLQTCCKMILLPLSICFYRYNIKMEQKKSAFLLSMYMYVCIAEELLQISQCFLIQLFLPALSYNSF